MTSARYLGVDISASLSWECPHRQNYRKKPGFLKRNIITKRPRAREIAYNTLVRPQLEYVVPVWDSHTQKNILQIEKIQRRAARWSTSDYDTRPSVTAMLGNLGWRTLEQIPVLTSSMALYMGLLQFPCQNISRPKPFSRNCHSMTFRQVHTSRNFYKYSFFPLAIVQWNALPEPAVCLPTLDAFKKAVGRLHHSRP